MDLIVLVIGVIGIIVFLAIGKVLFAWMLQIDRRIDLMKKQNQELESIVRQLDRIVNAVEK